MELDDPEMIPIAELIAHIIDYKSNFTRLHTQQIANRAWIMAEHYGYTMTEKIQLYLAAALHDLGKLAVPSEVLEKPGKLDVQEFEIIKTHITCTRSLLGAVDGLGPITEWASNHHEKLDGSGYPLKKTAADLDFNSRLMACIDIYQAVSEERPYHPRRTHAETMAVLDSMAVKGGIDPHIVKDMDEVMAPHSATISGLANRLHPTPLVLDRVTQKLSLQTTTPQFLGHENPSTTGRRGNSVVPKIRV